MSRKRKQNQRTSHLTITGRFMALCSLPGIILAVILAPWAPFVLIAYFVTLLLFWLGSAVFTNGFVRWADPEGYKQLKNTGGDPFYDSLGMPLNFDSEETRQGVQTQQAHRPNTKCPNCGTGMHTRKNQPARCPTCDMHWHENNWWQWTGKGWVLYAYGPGNRAGQRNPQPRGKPRKQKQQRRKKQPAPTRQFWTGQNTTTT